MAYFIYLSQLDCSENKLNISKFLCFPALKRLKRQMNSIRSLDINEERLFGNLEFLDLSFNHSLQYQSLDRLRFISTLRYYHEKHLKLIYQILLDFYLRAKIRLLLKKSLRHSFAFLLIFLVLFLI